MTQTRGVNYAKLTDKAYKLSMAIYREMDKIRVEGGIELKAPQPDEWSELHDLSQIASGLAGQLDRIRQREAEAASNLAELRGALFDQPVPYLPAGDLDAAMHAAEMDDLDADIRAANPCHPLCAPDPFGEDPF